MGFADSSLEKQYHGVLPTGGFCIECGEFTGASASATQAVPTLFSKLICGLATSVCADATSACVGKAVSICEGPTIDFTLTSADVEGVQYVAFGW